MFKERTKIVQNKFDIMPFVINNRFIFKDKKIYQIENSVLTKIEVKIEDKIIHFLELEIDVNDEFYSVKTEEHLQTSEIEFDSVFKIDEVVYFKFNWHEKDRFYSIC